MSNKYPKTDPTELDLKCTQATDEVSQQPVKKSTATPDNPTKAHFQLHRMTRNDNLENPSKADRAHKPVLAAQ